MNNSSCISILEHSYWKTISGFVKMDFFTESE